MTFTEQEKAILAQAETILHTKMVRSDCFNGAASVKLYLQTKLADLTNEVFGALFLDSQHQLIQDTILFTGTVNSCSVYPRILVENAIKTGSAALILYHNHPSFISEPSSADIAVTKDVQSALRLIDVSVLDHFIVGQRVCSFAERGLL